MQTQSYENPGAASARLTPYFRAVSSSIFSTRAIEALISINAADSRTSSVATSKRRGIGVTDRVLIFENIYYSVISPEGCAAILWKDGAKAPAAAEALNVCANQLEKLGVVDEVIAEPHGGAHNDPAQAAAAPKYSLHKHLNDLCALDEAKRHDTRYERYRHLGVYEEAGAVRS